MAIHTRKYCPHCRHVYQSYSSGSKHLVVGQGCPIITCPRCGKVFFDKGIKEPAFYKKKEKISVFDMIMTPMFPFGASGIFFSILALAYQSFKPMFVAIPAFAFYAYILFICIKNRKEMEVELSKKYEDSVARLSNKEYVIALINHGYRVPKSFLRENHPDLLNYKKQECEDD